MKAKKKGVKIAAITLVSVLSAFIITAGIYVLYVTLSYSRLPDNMALDINSRQELVLDKSATYKISTFNIGFGAYNHEYSFFMDSGTMKDGTKVSGKYAKAKNRDIVTENISGVIAASKELDADFMFFQEADVKSTRSRKVNQVEALSGAFGSYSYTFAHNFKSAYLLYPFNDPIGKSEAGIVTFSKYKTDSATRRSLPIDTGFSKFFDLDRCIMLSRLPVSGGKELVLINVHLSAYDAGGLIRQQQISMLKDILKTERENGNYVIAGGDFNHDIAGSSDMFDTQQLKPEWVHELGKSDLPEGFDFAAAVNAPTCRSTDMPYKKGVNYTVVIDGFIVSDNISVASITNIDLDFANSDHNPVLLEFGLL